jgi:hypothetical protein
MLPQHLPGSFCRANLPPAQRPAGPARQLFANEHFLLLAALGIRLALKQVD